MTAQASSEIPAQADSAAPAADIFDLRTAIPTTTEAHPLPDAPDATLPDAEPVPGPDNSRPLRVEAQQQMKTGSTYTLLGDATIDYRTYVVHADKMSYNQDTGDVEAEGHVLLQGGSDDERIEADHGTLNLDLDTGRFYNVLGTVGLRSNLQRTKVIYTGLNPLIFTGRVVIKSGPNRFQVIDGDHDLLPAAAAGLAHLGR